MNIRVVTMTGEIKYQGDVGPRGEKGEDGKIGKNLEFNWQDTSLGVRQEGETEYEYRNLRGPKGEDGYDDTELRNIIENKVSKEEGKGLSTNDYTTEEKNKLENLPTNPVTEEKDPTVPQHVKDITQENINKWNEGGVANILTFSNITLETTAWVEDTTYEEFGYKADVPCTGVTADFFSDVVFELQEAISGNYAPVSLTGTGTVTIYAVEAPESTITIPSIICSKGA